MGDGSIIGLVACALATDPGEDEYWEAVDALRRLGDRDALTVAVELIRSRSPAGRRLGIEVLAELGPPQPGEAVPRSFQDQVLSVLLELSATEKDPETLVSVVSALRSHRDPGAVGGIVRHVRHPETDVRVTVAMVLPDLAEDVHRPPARVLLALVELMTDDDYEVRNWATFGLGRSLRADSPAIRDALFDRIGDPDDVTAGEALRALAVRNDHRIVTALRDRLNRLADKVANRDALDLCAEAAAGVGAESLLPALAVHHTWRDASGGCLGWLDRAIDRCGRCLVLAEVERTFSGLARLRVREAGDGYHADLTIGNGTVVLDGYAVGRTGVLAAVAAEQRWLAERVGYLSRTVPEHLVRTRLDELIGFQPA